MGGWVMTILMYSSSPLVTVGLTTQGCVDCILDVDKSGSAWVTGDNKSNENKSWKMSSPKIQEVNR